MKVKTPRNEVQVLVRLKREDHVWIQAQAEILGLGLSDVAQMVIRLVRIGIDQVAKMEVGP